MTASLAIKTRLRPHREEPQLDRNLTVILKDREDEWKARPAPYATAFSNLIASRLSTLDRTYTVQLPPTLGDGKAFSLSFSVARNEELTLMSDTTLIGPGGKPEYLTAPGIGIGDHFITADARNARSIVPAKASADPDVMFKRRVLKKKPVSILTRSLQCFALSTMN
jgi:hypothetical protein